MYKLTGSLVELQNVILSCHPLTCQGQDTGTLAVVPLLATSIASATTSTIFSATVSWKHKKKY
jgi:hypothetical protein